MLRDYAKEKENRVNFIRSIVKEANASGIVFGASGGKDSALAGILCKMANPNTLGIIMPCESGRNYNEDKEDALLLGQVFNIEHIEIDITETKKVFKAQLEASGEKLNHIADINIAPRLRMVTLYAVGASRNFLVCGTGNKSEIHMGYFTKWGDGASDFNPIADLTVSEILEFLEYLEAPKRFYQKSPSAGLYEGQTDEKDMGITYKEIDKYLLLGEKAENYEKIERANKITEHKRVGVYYYE